MEEKIQQNQVVKKDEEAQQYVKSRAVVKYTSVNTPVHFSELKCNTDLNEPPSNWLYSSTKSYGLHHGLFRSNGFTSFHLAHMFPDCLGEVDVVSDAENIKHLLKIPYNKAPVSMMIHRIENTLLIDEFDIHRHLLLQAESEWHWLRKFFFDHVIQTIHEKPLGINHKYSRSMLQQKSLLSKFLHYSFNRKTDSGDDIKEPIPPPLTETSICPAGPALPEPELGEILPDAGSDYKFIRNVAWTFEDIQMLLGTDMPIFGGGTHPCISLRLRDIEKPISVLTGIDYWLDNLMSNVPEVVMCYHLDGIVQKYELIKTEDLPHLPDAKFSPKLIRDVAQNILSFLKTNATKAGHTYWLFKARNDDVVKLYDLTSLCSDSLIDKEQNPFTVPVGLLLYRVARNMKQSSDKTSLQPATIRMLLKNCLPLLPKEKYPQIVTSAHYMLSDIYLPVDTNPVSPQLTDDTCFDSSYHDVDEEEDDPTSMQVPIKSLCLAGYSSERGPKYQPPPLVGSLVERCKLSLIHVSEGLSCLQYFSLSNKMEDNRREEEPQMARSSEPIPMPYSKLGVDEDLQLSQSKEALKKPDTTKGNKRKEISSPKALLCRPKAEPVPSWQRSDKMDTNSWRDHLENLLLRKATLVYSTLIHHHYNSENFGVCLGCISNLLEISCEANPGLIGQELIRAGDCYFRIAKDWPTAEDHMKDFKQNMYTIEKYSQEKPKDWMVLPQDIVDQKEILMASRTCYQRARKFLPSNENVLIKIGNIHNEIGTYNINKKAYVSFQSETDPTEIKKLKALLNEAENDFNEGVKVFEKLGDVQNMAFLMSNRGKVMRMRAYYLPEPPDSYELQAEKMYLNALKVLGSRKEHPSVWDAVTWELSTTLFNIACRKEESASPDQSVDEVSKAVVDLFTRCLRYCDLTSQGPKQLLYQFRAAKIHNKLASLFHKQYMIFEDDENRKKYILKLTQNHYAKACEIIQTLECPSELLTVLFERISLYDYLATESSNHSVKIKHLQNALNLLVEMKPLFIELEEKSKAMNASESNFSMEDNDKKEEDKILFKLDIKLCDIFKKLMKFSLKHNKQTPTYYKEGYSLLLKKDENCSFVTVCRQLIDILIEGKAKPKK